MSRCILAFFLESSSTRWERTFLEYEGVSMWMLRLASGDKTIISEDDESGSHTSRATPCIGLECDVLCLEFVYHSVTVCL